MDLNIDDWRTMLRQHFKKPGAKKQLAEDLGVQVRSIDRWLAGTRPGLDEYIRALATIIPGREVEMTASLKEEFPEAFGNSDEQESANRVMAPHILQALKLLRTTDKRSVEWGIMELTFRQILAQLDTGQGNLLVLYAQCIPDEHGDIRKLLCHASSAVGSGEWATRPVRQSFYVGDKTLTATAAKMGKPVFYPGDYRLYFTHIDGSKEINSAAAYPIMRHGLVAGAIMICSTDRDFFTYNTRDLLNIFSMMFSLAPLETEFYPPEKIKLVPLPLQLDIEEREVIDD